MPYIKRDDKQKFYDNGLVNLAPQVSSPGELNYVISYIIADYFERHRNYQGINDILGALTGAQLEFYRRVAVPYEDIKIKENGDVY